eukprot:2942304-Pleurochrysis_carterae.AAC.1
MARLHSLETAINAPRHATVHPVCGCLSSRDPIPSRLRVASRTKRREGLRTRRVAVVSRGRARRRARLQACQLRQGGARSPCSW